jgi:cysteine-rich repeat protein
MQHGTMSRLVFATLLVALGTPPPATAVDLSGDYLVSPIPCRLTLVQTGTALQLSGSCSVDSTTYPLSSTGTVDPATGAFSLLTLGEIRGLCADLVCSGTGDGEETRFTCASSTPACYGPILATKCGNGVIDPLENCEDGNHADADCCSARCRLDPAGTACTSDDACTAVCDAAGTCTHVPVPPGKCRRALVSRDVARCMATQCDGIGRETCRRRCKPAAIRTLAYAVSECRVDAGGFVVARQALRIRRGDREPITVVEFGPSEPIPDPQGLCRRFGRDVWGSSSVVMFPLQRLGVSPDGSGVVFEINDEFSITAPWRLSPEQGGSSSSAPTATECVGSARRAATRASASGRISSAACETSGGSLSSPLRYSSARTVVGSPSRISDRDPGAWRPYKSSCSISRPGSAGR